MISNYINKKTFKIQKFHFWLISGGCPAIRVKAYLPLQSFDNLQNVSSLNGFLQGWEKKEVFSTAALNRWMEVLVGEMQSRQNHLSIQFLK